MARQIASVLAIVVPAAVSACMGIGDAPVRFTGQRNVVVWDRMRGIEYFVRDAQFETRGKSLGFIAPTPTSPSIKSVGPTVFTRFERLAPGAGMAGGAGGGGGFGGGMGGGVTVVRQQTVAGYEATTLRASDPHALVDWLTGNGYSVPRYATRWSEPYVRRGWYFTAFKVSAENGTGATGPVCMTFTTKTP